MALTELAELLGTLLGTSEDEAVAALRAALRQHKAEEARARVAFARAASAPMLQAAREAIEAAIAPLEAAYTERKARQQDHRPPGSRSPPTSSAE